MTRAQLVLRTFADHMVQTVQHILLHKDPSIVDNLAVNVHLALRTPADHKARKVQIR